MARFLSGFTSEISRTLKIMPLLIASSLKRVRVKNKERNHMVTSEKSLKKKKGQAAQVGRDIPKDSKATAEITFLH